MYCTYTYAAGSTALNLVTDIVKLCCGETVKANLSANCSALDITTAVSTAGWSLYDIQAAVTTPTIAWTKNSAPTHMTTLTHISGTLDGSTTEWGVIYYRYSYSTNLHTLKLYKSAADRTADTNAIASGTLTSATGTMTLTGTTGWTQLFTTPTVGTWDGTITANYAAMVIRAPYHADNGGADCGYHYLKIDAGSTALAATLYESWNTTTHVGANPAVTTATYLPTISTSLGGNVYLSIQGGQSLLWQTYSNGKYGNATQTNCTSGFMERSRWSPWDTNANGYPTGCNAVTAATAMPLASIFISRMYTPGADTISTTLTGTTVLAGATTSQSADSSKQAKHLFLPIHCYNATNIHLGGDMSKYSDAWCFTANSGSMLDEITEGAKTYVIWVTGGTSRLAVRKG